MPKVSIVMPSLNVRPYIEECLDSVQNQTLKDIEILCVDAGSTDGTLEFLRERAAADTRIQVIESDRKSYGYQINLGLRAAVGEYFGIVETDDYIPPEMYEELTALASKDDLDVIKGDFYRFFGEGKARTYEYADIAAGELYGKILDPSRDPGLLDNRSLYSWAGIYKRSFLLDKEIWHNETPGASYQDNGFFFQVFTQASRLSFVRKPYYCLRRDNPDSSINSKAKVYCMCEEYDFIRNYLRKDPELEKRFAPYCALFRMKNYDFTYNRVAQEYKREFLNRYAADFRKIREDGELRENLYTQQQWERLESITEDPDLFYYTHCPRELLFEAEPAEGLPEEQIFELRARLQAAKKLLEESKWETRVVKSSLSYRLGRVITWLPRMLRATIRSMKENGLAHTGALIANKMRKR